MKKNLISIAVISVLYGIMVLIVTPFEEINFNNFAGLIGVFIYYMAKIALEIISSKKAGGNTRS